MKNKISIFGRRSMERLTKMDTQNRLLAYSISDTGLPTLITSGNPYRKLIEKLKSYEDTGLTPEEIIDGKMLTGWIPVEEGLPEKNATYCLVTTTRSPRIEMAWYLGGDWYWNNSDAKMGGVFAWMPLPEPYRLEALREAGQDAAEQVIQSAT